MVKIFFSLRGHPIFIKAKTLIFTMLKNNSVVICILFKKLLLKINVPNIIIYLPTTF